MQNKVCIYDLALLLNRIIFGTYIVFGHGWGKLERLLDGNIQFSSVFGLPPIVNLILAIFAEVLCGIALILGFRTRWVSIPLIATMLVAAFVVHGSDPFFIAKAGSGGSKELAVLFLAGFLTSLLLGSGRYSLDFILYRKKN